MGLLATRMHYREPLFGRRSVLGYGWTPPDIMGEDWTLAVKADGKHALLQ